MKTLFLMGTFALLSTTLFSCTAEELETADKKTEINKPVPAFAIDGPDDDPVPVKPPKK